MTVRTRPALAAAALLGVAMLAGCGGEPEEDPAAGSTTAPESTSSSAAEPSSPSGSGSAADPSRPAPPAFPDAPDVGRPAALAAQLDDAHRLIVDPETDPVSVRAAGEFDQLAARALARAPQPRSAAVIGRLDADTRFAVTRNVRSAGELQELSQPQPKYPADWRVGAPRPAADLLRYYHRAERITGTPWEYLAAINLVETRMGRVQGTSTAGALGPMQFLPTTWDLYGEGGDIRDPRDAITAAGRLLAANGAPDDMAGALWHYNPTEHYVRAVTAHAEVLQRQPNAYAGYHAWRVLYNHADGTMILPVGYPDLRPVPVPGG